MNPPSPGPIASRSWPARTGRGSQVRPPSRDSMTSPESAAIHACIGDTKTMSFRLAPDSVAPRAWSSPFELPRITVDPTIAAKIQSDRQAATAAPAILVPSLHPLASPTRSADDGSGSLHPRTTAHEPVRPTPATSTARSPETSESDASSAVVVQVCPPSRDSATLPDRSTQVQNPPAVMPTATASSP